MNNLEKIFLSHREEKKSQLSAKELRQQEITRLYTEKCNEIVTKLSFLTKYNFELVIQEYTEYDCCSTCQGYKVKKVVIKRIWGNKVRSAHHFAILYPCPKSDKYDFSSWQLEMNGRTFYTYESAVKVIADKI